MTALILTLTHLAAAGVGAATAYTLTVRHVTSFDHDGHSALELRHQEEDHMNPPRPEPTLPDPGRDPDRDTDTEWPWFHLIVLSVALMIVGWTTYQGRQDAVERDQADRAYAQCLTRFAGDLVDTIEARSEAGQLVSRAKDDRAAAVDEALRILALSRRVPPEATAAQLDATLATVAEARTRLDRATRREADVREANQYESPRAVCQR